MKYLFDTNAILIYLKDSMLRSALDKKHSPLADEHTAVVSVVTLGEIESLAIRNQWGVKKRSKTEEFLHQFLVTDINARDLINIYGEIDAYSQNRLPNRGLGMSARNMDKNDLWIAATAVVTKSTLISSDKDFLHLRGEYLEMVYIDVEEKVIN